MIWYVCYCVRFVVCLSVCPHMLVSYSIFKNNVSNCEVLVQFEIFEYCHLVKDRYVDLVTN